jgi:hypothetical protein
METTMHLSDAAMIAGLCLAVGACAFLLATQVWTAQRAGGQDVHFDSAQRGGRLDLYMAAVWSGFLVVQASSVFRHMQPDGTLNLSSLSLAAFAADVFICGGFAGRLLLRREMRLSREKDEERNGAVRA